MFKRNILLLALFLSLSLIFAQENIASVEQSENQQMPTRMSAFSTEDSENFREEKILETDTMSVRHSEASAEESVANETSHSEQSEESVNNKTASSENPSENPQDCKKQTFFVVNFPKNFEKKVLDYARIDNSFSTEKGILSNYLTISLSNSFDYLYGENFSAVQFTENSTSFIFENVFWLIRTYKIQNENPKLIFKLGATLYYNYEYLDFISSKHNLFYGINFEHNFRNLITSRGQVFCGNRFSHIFALGNEDPYIHNWDFQAKFEFIFHSTFKLDPYVSIASFEDFRYPLFCAPIFSLGVVYETNKNFNFGILGSVRYIDFFTLSSYIDSWVLKFYVEYKIDEVTNLFSKLMNGGS